MPIVGDLGDGLPLMIIEDVKFCLAFHPFLAMLFLLPLLWMGKGGQRSSVQKIMPRLPRETLSKFVIRPGGGCLSFVRC
jgi:hypothetical protein